MKEKFKCEKCGNTDEFIFPFSQSNNAYAVRCAVCKGKDGKGTWIKWTNKIPVAAKTLPKEVAIPTRKVLVIDWMGEVGVSSKKRLAAIAKAGEKIGMSKFYIDKLTTELMSVVEIPIVTPAPATNDWQTEETKEIIANQETIAYVDPFAVPVNEVV